MLMKIQSGEWFFLCIFFANYYFAILQQLGIKEWVLNQNFQFQGNSFSYMLF